MRCDWCCSKAPHSKNNHCSSCFKRKIQSLEQEYKSTSYLHVVRWVTLAGGCTHKYHQRLIDEAGLWAQTWTGTFRSAAYKHVSRLSRHGCQQHIKSTDRHTRNKARSPAWHDLLYEHCSSICCPHTACSIGSLVLLALQGTAEHLSSNTNSSPRVITQFSYVFS